MTPTTVVPDDGSVGRPWGRYAGQIEVAADFDDTPTEVIDAMERPIRLP